MIDRRQLLPLALSPMLLLSTTSALPHASVIRSSPPADATLKSAPREVSILFGERVQAPSDAIIVQDGNGARVDQGNARVDGNGHVMRVSLRPLSGGAYIVAWRARSADGHTARGTFTFRVQK
jgi:methionine-rich copper-binding protein CopC